MWDDEAPLVLGWLKQHYLVDYAALPLNTHQAESNVKDANFCQVKGSAETLLSTFLTALSGIVKTLNDNAIAAFKAQGNVIRGMKTVTRGTYGNRKNRKDGSDYMEKESKTRVDKLLQTQEAIRLIIKKNTQMEAKLTLPTNKAKWEEVRKFISNKINQFEEQCVLVKTEEYEKHFDDVGAPNVLQRRVGRVKMMPLLEGLVTYSMMLKDQDIGEVKKELRFCGLSEEGGWQKQLLCRLKKDKADRGSDDKENFRPLQPHADFRAAMEGQIDEDNLSDEEEEDW
jgi:hypothetical protein